jgi:DNA-binding LacI/PurR family transcriptional regulator
LPTIRDVARRAGVSIATVSAVTNGGKGVSEAVRQRVWQAVAELGYRPSLVARALHSGRTQSLALLVPSVANPYFAAIVQAVERQAHARGYSLFVATSEGDPGRVASYRERILAMGIDGVLATLSWDVLEGNLVPVLLERGIPVVGVAGSRAAEGLDCFVADDLEAGRQLGRYLFGLGHRAVAFLGPPDSAAAAQRARGLEEAMAEAGVAPDPRLRVELDGHGEGSGYRGVEILLARGVRFTAVVAFNDAVALGALNALEDQGLRVPERVSVAGFGDTVSAYARPKITTVTYPKEELGRLALDRLLQRIGGWQGPPEVRRLPVGLAVRQSTRAPADGGA